MAYFEWSDSLSVKIPSIDRQHQMLVGYINDLHKAVSKNDGHSATKSILDKLVNYATVHFLYEEMLFGTYEYREEQEHKESHQRFIEQIEKMAADLSSGNQDIPQQLLEMLRNWLNHHIMKEDMAYSEFLLMQGVE